MTLPLILCEGGHPKSLIIIQQTPRKLQGCLDSSSVKRCSEGIGQEAELIPWTLRIVAILAKMSGIGKGPISPGFAVEPIES
jgi:hypothetical protein